MSFEIGGFNKKPATTPQLISLVISIICASMMVFALLRSPIKTPPMIAMACICSSSCSSSTATLINDIILRFKGTDEEEEEE